MFIPNVGQCVKLKTLGGYYVLGVTPNWQWLEVKEIWDASPPSEVTRVFVSVLDGDKPTGITGPVKLDAIDPPLGYREAKPGEYLFEIGPEKVAEVREWFKNRGGVLRWTNKDLGNCGAPDKITPALPNPGETKQAPGWAYVGDAFPVKAKEIGVRTVTAVSLPPEWFPKCDRCDGTGKVTVASLAKIRKQSQKKTRADLEANGTTFVDRKHIQCWCCNGTGHKERHIRVAVRKAPWIGYDLTETGKEKARKTAKKLGADVKWDFEHVGYGLAHLKFYREKIEPFTVE